MPLQIAFLTGRSAPRSSALSAVQAQFLDALPAPSESKVTRNFPFETSDRSTFPSVSLLVASIRNTWQYASSRLPAFAPRHRPPVDALLARADHTLLLAGSCGLELFNNLALPPDVLRSVTIFAYGPVARRRPDCASLLVQGRRDWLSRVYFRTVDVRVNAGHMDYLTCPQVVMLARETVRRLITINPS